MTKFFKNLFKLLLIGTPFFIIFKFIKNFLPNYKTKKKSINLEKNIYDNFISFNDNEKWFCNNLYFLTKNLSNSKGISHILEIGSYEGRSAIFYLSLFPNSTITCVDTWTGSDEHDSKNFSTIENNFDQNTLQYKELNRLNKFKMSSNEFFLSNKNKFDLIYVDGDHSANQVKVDIDNAWKLVNSGGLLILDDYLWWFYKDLKKNPATAINDFITSNIKNIKHLIVWKQVIIQKK